jgi:hypothetical protein
LAETLNLTVPPPLPLVGGFTVIHDAWLVAVQAHPADVEIVIVVPAPPDAPMDWSLGAMEYEQLGAGGGGGDAAAAWFTVKV